MGNKLYYCSRLPVLLFVMAMLVAEVTVAQTIRPSAQRELKIYDPNSSGTGHISLRAAAGTASYTLTLPSADGSNGQFLTTNGTGTLSWSAPANSWALSGNSGTTNGGSLGSAPTGNFLGTTGTTTNARDLSFVTNNTIQLQLSTAGVLSSQNDMLVNGVTVGHGAGNIATNIAMGSSTLSANTTGDKNTAVGVEALNKNNVGYSNVAIGWQALYSNTTGLSNAVLGAGALRANTIGYNNTAVGFDAGKLNNAGGNNETSSNAVYIGYDARSGSDGNSNEIVIGASAIGSGSNTATFGNSSLLSTHLRGHVHLTYPANSSIASQLRLYEPGTSGSNFTAFQSQTQSSDLTYTLPAAAPSISQVLGVSVISGGEATLTWVNSVNSFSGGTTGLTPATATTGDVTLAGTLNVANGGTGTNTLTGIALGNGTGAFTGITSSLGLANALSDETGSGALVFGTAPTVSSLTVVSGGATITAGGLTVTAGGASVIGNILVNNNSGSAGELRLLEPSTSGTNYTAFRAQSQTTDVTYSLPASDGSNGQVLSTNGGGTLSWTTVTTTVPISTLVAATSTNTINNGALAQIWQWNSLEGATALTLSSSSTAAASNAQTLLSVSLSGANGTATQTTYGVQISNEHTGTASTNIGLQVSASGATNNYGLLVNNGNVGIGITTPASALHIDRGTATNSYLQFTAGGTTSQTASDGFDIGVDANGVAIINQQENLALQLMTNNTTRLTIAAGGEATFSGNVTGVGFFETSDQRLKNVLRRDGEVAYFKWKDGRDTKIHVGYLAQEVQQRMSDQVKEDEHGILSVNYTEVLVSKIRDLEKRIEELEKRNRSTKKSKSHEKK